MQFLRNHSAREMSQWVSILGALYFILFYFILFFNILLDVFFIYISNAIPKVPYALTPPPPCSPTHPLPLLDPGIPLY
jgi:hypothetical protein